MVGRDELPIHIRQHPDELHQGLKIITETTRRFVTQVVQRGADGLFFASQAVDPNYITPEEHAAFAKHYDLQVLEATSGKTWFDIFHLHGREISFDQVLDYPVHAFNYHDRDYEPSLSEMRKRTTKCLLGGIPPGGPIANGTPDRWRGRSRTPGDSLADGFDHHTRRGGESTVQACQRRPPAHGHRGHTAALAHG